MNTTGNKNLKFSCLELTFVKAIFLYQFKNTRLWKEWERVVRGVRGGVGLVYSFFWFCAIVPFSFPRLQHLSPNCWDYKYLDFLWFVPFWRNCHWWERHEKLMAPIKSTLFKPLFHVVNKQCVAYRKFEQHLSTEIFMVQHFGKHDVKQLYRIHGNLLSLAISCGYRQSRRDAVFNSVRRKDTCNTVKICHRLYFLDQGHSRVNMYVSVLQITGL